MAAGEQQRHSHDHHSHHHTPGTCCSNSDSSFDDVWLNKSDDGADEREISEVERGPPNFERVVLLIDGLQCGCCEGGITRTIARMPAIQNHQVNVVLARLEFELDTNRMSVADVIAKLGTNTGYAFEEHFAPSSEVLELLVVDAARVQLADMPFGVSRIESTGQQSGHFPSRISGEHLVRVHYDALQIGARDVFEYYQQILGDIKLAPPVPHTSLAMGAKQTRHALFWFLPALVLTLPVVVLAWAPIDHGRLIYAHISLALATLVQIIAIKQFVPNAWRSLWYARVFEMDFLIALSSGIAYAFSLVAYAFQVKGKSLKNMSSFFETSTMLVTLILLGRVINEFARYKAAKSVSFRSLQAEEALLLSYETPFLTAADPKTRRIDARLLQYGDTFKVVPHSQIVTDGVVLYGGSEVDESMITGESIPVAKGVHSTVSAGTTNGEGTLVVRLTALPHENSVHKIATMVEDAELTKPRTQALADRIAGWFVPAMASLGIIVFLIWLFVGRFATKRSWEDAAVQAVTYAIATLVVSCPCAIGLAVPMVVLIAGGVAARHGIIFRDPQMLETARNVTDVVFDKTGTLTSGVLTVVGQLYYGPHAHQVKGILMSLLQDIKHPVAAGVLQHLEENKKDLTPIAVSYINSIPGSGVHGTCTDSGLEVRAGNPEWLNLEIDDSRCTLLCVSINNIHSATFKLQDQARNTAQLVIDKLHSRGIATHMISGDRQGPVDDIAHTLSIPKRNTRAHCTPTSKQHYVQSLQTTPQKIIMFVGDGTNDSIALKQSSIGVHLSPSSSSPTTTTTAKQAADIILMTPRLSDLLLLIDISRAAYRRILLNFCWSALYNVAAVLLAAGAFTGLLHRARIDPQFAGLGELVSVLPVVLVAFHMRWRRYGGGVEGRDEVEGVAKGWGKDGD